MIQIRKAIVYVAEATNQRQISSSRRLVRKQDDLGTFFETQCLAIMRLLSDTISEVNGHQVLPERKRSIAAVKEMISIGKAHVCSALPQVSMLEILAVVRNTPNKVADISLFEISYRPARSMR